MIRRLFSPLTLVNQLALIVLLLAALGVAGMTTAGWLAQGIQGSAHAINKAGSLRMQSYRLLAAVPLKPQDKALLDEMSETVKSPELRHASVTEDERQGLNALATYWQTELSPALQRASNPDEVHQEVAQFVSQIDLLVTAFDHTTEERIKNVAYLQISLAILMGLLLIFTVIWLRQRLLRPWRQLLAMAAAIGQRDFTFRASVNGRDEMATLGRALNSMSAELAESYSVLETRVQEKTAGLEHKNEILAFLWEASRRLHSGAPLCERLAPILNQLQELTLLRNIELRVYDSGDDESLYQEFAWRPDAHCAEKNCHLCPQREVRDVPQDITLKWRLVDNHCQYGLMLARLPQGCHLSRDQRQMLDTLMEQISATLAIERQQERQQQLVVMEERSAIARELHDSIAQSLSCMKMQVSCLQMQGAGLPEQSRDLLGQVRNELNSSWRQLRELLTTFRLKLTEAGLRPALEESCAEFSARLGFQVALDYRLTPRRVPSHQAIHLVQIAREALNNALKHANATEIGVQVTQQGNEVRLTVQDNGCGLPEKAERSNHYGLIIMRDRAQSLHGDCQVRRRESGGTEVIVTFVPDAPTISVQGTQNELSGTGNNSADRRSSDATHWRKTAH